ncbi:MAG: SDR family oxidoreductase [Marmoricola sp.]
MRYFVTGASGWIGSATVRELVAAGHDVVGLARSDASAEAVEALGATPLRGDLDDLALLRAGARDSDGVIHLGYNHDFSRMAEAAASDHAVIAALGEELTGSGRLLAIASGTLGVTPGRVATEADRPAGGGHPRVANAALALRLAEQGVRSVVVRFSPTVHGPGDHGFIAVLTEVARERGVAAWIGEGGNRWPAVHRDDAAVLLARAAVDAPAGTVLHAVAEEGVSGRTIAEAIGAGLGVPTSSIPAEDAPEHFGWIGPLFALDAPASNAATRELLDWHPGGATLVEDIAAHYTV